MSACRLSWHDLSTNQTHRSRGKLREWIHRIDRTVISLAMMVNYYLSLLAIEAARACNDGFAAPRRRASKIQSLGRLPMQIRGRRRERADASRWFCRRPPPPTSAASIFPTSASSPFRCRRGPRCPFVSPPRRPAWGKRSSDYELTSSPAICSTPPSISFVRLQQLSRSYDGLARLCPYWGRLA